MTTFLALVALVVSIVAAVTSITIARNAKHQATIAQDQAQTARKALEINQRALAQKMTVSTDGLFALTIANSGTLPFRSVSIYFKDFKDFKDFDGTPVTDYYDVGDGTQWQEDSEKSTAEPSQIADKILLFDTREWTSKVSKVAQCS